MAIDQPSFNADDENVIDQSLSCCEGCSSAIAPAAGRDVQAPQAAAATRPPREKISCLMAEPFLWQRLLHSKNCCPRRPAWACGAVDVGFVRCFSDEPFASKEAAASDDV
mmetsp:Transcript_52636/g.125749  ORF Transcript_52636/g.125749 Transcript_52636/m.125749 type:complete len:110 (+) Transcript_52636:65-394(+)